MDSADLASQERWHAMRRVAVGVHITGVRRRLMILDDKLDVGAGVALAGEFELGLGGDTDEVALHTARGKATVLPLITSGVWLTGRWRGQTLTTSRERCSQVLPARGCELGAVMLSATGAATLPAKCCQADTVSQILSQNV